MTTRAPRSAAELDAKYRTVAELRSIARNLGLATTGSKAELARRIGAHLDGVDDVQQPGPSTNRRARALRPPFELDTSLDGPVRLTRELRDWMNAEAGTNIRANQRLRDYLASSALGRTLGGALEAWRDGVARPETAIAPQFEYNAFVRQWRSENPGASHAEVVAAWKVYRDSPEYGSLRPPKPSDGAP